MIKRLNFTERRRITHDQVSIALESGRQGVSVSEKAFLVTLNLGEEEFPSEAELYVEAYRGASYMRFPWGTVGAPQPPAQRQLHEIEPGDIVYFRLKVVGVGPAAGRILGEADHLLPHDPTSADRNRRSILEVDFRPLGDCIWQVDFTEVRPILVLNNAISGIGGDIRGLFLSDHRIQALVYPAVARQILERALMSGEYDLEGPSDGWQSDWIRFALTLHPEHPPERQDTDAGIRAEDDTWIQAVIEAFSGKMHFPQGFSQAVSLDQDS